MALVRVQEVRKLILPVETVVDAVLELDRLHGGSLAQGEMLEVRVETGAEPGLTLVVMQGTGPQSAALQKHYTAAAIAAACIHYCSRAHIPVPRYGTKSIEIHPEGFELSIKQVTELNRLHGQPPPASQVDLDASPVITAVGDAAMYDPTNLESDGVASAA